jgi:hypothetical protein
MFWLSSYYADMLLGVEKMVRYDLPRVAACSENDEHKYLQSEL